MTRRKKILLLIGYIGTPLFLIWIGYSVYSYNLPHADRLALSGKATAFYDLPRISVGNVPGMGHNHTLKVSLSLEVPANDYPRMEDYEPRIMEKILFFMRNKTPEELQLPDGQLRLRESLQDAIGHGAFPIHIVSVAIREMVVE